MGKLVSYNFSKKDRIADKPKPSVKPDPLVSRKLVRCIEGIPLKQDAYGHFYILKPSPISTSLIRIEIPYDHGFWVMQLADDMLTSDQKIQL